MASKIFKVLICDDSLLVREKLKESLKEIGEFAVAEAGNSQDSIDTYRDFRPHLVFMDIVMPDKDGIEVLKDIISFDDQAKVIILSSSGTRSHLKKAIEAGAIDFIQKPWETSQLEAIVRRIENESEGK